MEGTQRSLNGVTSIASYMKYLQVLRASKPPGYYIIKGYGGSRQGIKPYLVFQTVRVLAVQTVHTVPRALFQGEIFFGHCATKLATEEEGVKRQKLRNFLREGETIQVENKGKDKKRGVDSNGYGLRGFRSKRHFHESLLPPTGYYQ